MSGGLIKDSVATIFSKASKLSEISDEIIYGMTFEVIDDIDDIDGIKGIDNEWLYIKTEYDYKGYINKGSVVLDNDLIKDWMEIRNCIVINNFADILVKDKIQSSILVTLPRGAYLSKTGKGSADKAWSQVQLVDGTLGWVKSSFIRDVRSVNISEDEFRDNLIEDSLRYMGTQYRWGGKTPEGIDCSGLCSMVYMINGVNIYRDASIVEGFPIEKIDIKDIKKGDLLYFPGHIAMYLGDDQYIHSSNSNNLVKINSLNKDHDNYWEYLAKSILYVGSLFKR